MAKQWWAHAATATAVVCCVLLAVIQLYSNGPAKQVKLLQQSRIRKGFKSTMAIKQSSLAKSTLSSKPAHAPQVLTSHSRKISVASKHAKVSKKTLVRTVKPGLSIFNKIKHAMLKDLKLNKPSKLHRLQKKAEIVDAESSVEEDMEKNEEDPTSETNFDPEKSTVYVYAGREVKPQGTEIASYILQSGLGVAKVGYLNSASDADVRSALWDEDCKVFTHHFSSTFAFLKRQEMREGCLD
jgi:hypothetical protein